VKPMFSNRFIDALAKTILFFASTHLLILTYIGIRHDIDALNAFNIMSLNSFLPSLGQGVINFLLSYCMVAGVYLVAYLYLSKPANKENRDSLSQGNLDSKLTE